MYFNHVAVYRKNTTPLDTLVFMFDKQSVCHPLESVDL